MEDREGKSKIDLIWILKTKEKIKIKKTKKRKPKAQTKSKYLKEQRGKKPYIHFPTLSFREAEEKTLGNILQAKLQGYSQGWLLSKLERLMNIYEQLVFRSGF